MNSVYIVLYHSLQNGNTPLIVIFIMCSVEHNEFSVYIVYSILSVSNIHSVVEVNFSFGILLMSPYTCVNEV